MKACECQNLGYKKRYKHHEVHCACCGGSLAGEFAAAQLICRAWEQQTCGSMASELALEWPVFSLQHGSACSLEL